VNGLAALVVARSGQSNSAPADMFGARTRATVRYADPAAWITATAVARALSDFEDRLTASQHDVGVVVVSDQGPNAAMSEVQGATSTGFSSPLRYAASNPGSLVAVACIAFGFRGPTLNLTMRPEDGVPVALQICASWLTRRSARWMVLATFRAESAGTGFSRAILLAQADQLRKPGNSSIQSAAEWLTQSDETRRIHEDSYTEAH